MITPAAEKEARELHEELCRQMAVELARIGGAGPNGLGAEAFEALLESRVRSVYRVARRAAAFAEAEDRGREIVDQSIAKLSTARLERLDSVVGRFMSARTDTEKLQIAFNFLSAESASL